MHSGAKTTPWPALQLHRTAMPFGDRFDQGNRNERFDRNDRRPDDRRFDDRGSDGRKSADRGTGGRNYGDRQGRQDNRSDRGGNDWWPHAGGRPAQALTRPAG